MSNAVVGPGRRSGALEHEVAAAHQRHLVRVAPQMTAEVFVAELSDLGHDPAEVMSSAGHAGAGIS